MLKKVCNEELLDIIDKISDIWGDVFDGGDVPSLSEYGLENLGEGGGRIAYKYKDYAIKIPKTEDGDLQTETELKIFKESSHKMLCPIIYSNYGLLVMSCASQLHNYSYDNIVELFKDEENSNELLEQWIVLSDILVNKYNLIYDDIVKLDSWGKIDNQFVLFDYGCTIDIMNNYY